MCQFHNVNTTLAKVTHILDYRMACYATLYICLGFLYGCNVNLSLTGVSPKKILGQCVAWTSAEADFLDVIGTKILRGFLPCYSQSPQLTETQKPQRKCTFMNFASVVIIHPHLSGTHRSGTHSQGIYVCIRTRCVCTVFDCLS